MNLYRSINIRDDLNRHEVIAAYRPTRKSLQVVRAVYGHDRSAATHVVAPYGNGKSLAALAGITLAAGKADTKDPLVDRISVVDPAFAGSIRAQEKSALVVLLHGACPDLAATLSKQAGLEIGGPLPDVLEHLLRKARQAKASQIVIVWDEFGQHLETLVRDGRSEDLLAVQDLAEWVVRRSKPMVTLTTLMHQGMHHYTRRMADSAQTAWKKIEGRFETLSLIEDDLDAMEMLAEAVGGDGDCPDAEALARARSSGLFDAVPDEGRLADLITRAIPLTPPALCVLPRLASQVAQAERTMFRFVEEVVTVTSPKQNVGLDEIYDFFAPAMRADTGAGGTHRRLIEAETALSRAETDLEREILKAATLLQLGRSSERIKLPRARLVYAVQEGRGRSGDEIEGVIEALVARKLLIHRRRVDDISVWHGADLDLAQMVSEEAARLAHDSDTISDLERLFPPDAYTAPPYNHARAITRFARARFVRAAELVSPERLAEIRALADAEDAFVALVVDATAEDKALRDIAKSLPRHLIVALPQSATEITAVLGDLLGIGALLDRPEVIDTDPLVKRELLELKSEAEAALRQELDRLMNPDRGDVVWLCGADSHSFRGGITAGEVLSQIFEERFPNTPIIRNEQLVRRKVTAVTRSARKRCMLAVFERSGAAHLGYEGSTAADASLYRTVFERTGLYRTVNKTGRWADPAEVSDPGLKIVWGVLQSFFSVPDDRPKNATDLLDELLASPIGLREGILPLFIAAGLIAFGRALSLRERVDGQAHYVDDIKPSVIETLCERPGRFEIEVAQVTDAQLQTIETMIRSMVGSPDPQEPDRIRGFYDAFLEWRSGLPPTALRTKNLGSNADLVQPLIRRKSLDPMTLLCRDLPRVVGAPPLSRQCGDVFAAAVSEMECVSVAFAARAADVASEVFNARVQGSGLPLLKSAGAWANCMPDNDEALRQLDHEARGVLARARAAQTASRGDIPFVRQLSGILCGEGFDAWDDETVTTFRARLEAAILRVEDAVLSAADDSEAFEPFLKNRLASIFATYSTKIGRDRLRQYLDEIDRETP